MTNHRQQRDDHDLSSLLSDDVLADILRRLAPRWLAASRCVCKTWHAVIDGHRLQRTDLLPLSLDGIIINFRKHLYSEFFFHPSTPTLTRPSIGGKFEHLLTTEDWARTTDHCNGFILLEFHRRRCKEYVANPAKRWAAPLPACPSPCSATKGDYYNKYLVFDPTVSGNYEVFSIPRLFERNLMPELLEKSEWPPSTLIIRVFSSVSQRWEERSFIREGEPARLTTVVQFCNDRHFASYWRGSLYVHCEKDFVIRISSSNNKFKVIEPPVGIGGDMSLRYCTQLYLGRSEKGVYYASLVDRWLRVWILDESCGHSKWVSKHDKNLEPVLPRRARNQHVHGPWILQDINYHSRAALNHHLEDDNEPSQSRQKFKWNITPIDETFEWNPNGDDALEDNDMIKVDSPGYLDILGFHPYKEIVFFSESIKIGLAYHLNTSKFQVLGKLSPTNYGDFVDLPDEQEILSSFPYTPCLIEMCS